MKTRKRIFKWVIIVIAALLINLAYYVFIGQGLSMKKLSVNKDLNLYERVSIYQMHVTMWSLGWIIAPEAAMEARLMHKKHTEPVIIYSSFPSLAKPELWENGVYSLKDPQLKYALALNTEDLKFEKTTDYTKCTLTVRYTNNVHRVCGVPVHTALFKYLQDINWLYPYQISFIDIKVE